MVRSIDVYRTGVHGFVRAGTFSLRDDGTVGLGVDEPTHEQFMSAMLNSGFSKDDGSVIASEDGEAFLVALLENLQSTYWHAVEGGVAPPITSQGRAILAQPH